MKGTGLVGTVLEVVNLAAMVKVPLGMEGSSKKVTPGLGREEEEEEEWRRKKKKVEEKGKSGRDEKEEEREESRKGEKK